MENKEVFSIIYCNIDNQLKDYYSRQKREFMRKYKLKEIKQSKPKTYLESCGY